MTIHIAKAPVQVDDNTHTSSCARCGELLGTFSMKLLAFREGTKIAVDKHFTAMYIGTNEPTCEVNNG